MREGYRNASSGWIHLGGWVGIATAAVAWYASAAGVINGMKAPAVVLPVGSPLTARGGSPMQRRQHVGEITVALMANYADASHPVSASDSCSARTRRAIPVASSPSAASCLARGAA